MRDAEGRERVGDWMQTYTGLAFWPLDPRVDEVRIEDIAHAIAHLCRYAGHVVSFYSVAEHSLLMSSWLEREGYGPLVALQGLMHDATEAYVVDVPRPIKRYLAGYAEIEGGVWAVIAEAFGLPLELDPAVKVADDGILMDERMALMRTPPIPWSTDRVPLNVPISGLAPHEAEAAFLARFYALRGRL